MRKKFYFVKSKFIGCYFCFSLITYTKGKKETTYFLDGKGVTK